MNLLNLLGIYMASERKLTQQKEIWPNTEQITLISVISTGFSHVALFAWYHLTSGSQNEAQNSTYFWTAEHW